MVEHIERPRGMVSAGEIVEYLKSLAELSPEEVEKAIAEMSESDREQVKAFLPVLKDVLEKH